MGFGTSCLGSQPCGGASGHGLVWGHHKFPTGAGGAVVGLGTLLPRGLPPLSPSSHPKVPLRPSILLTTVPSPAKAAQCSSASAPWAWGSSGTPTKTRLSPWSSGLLAQRKGAACTNPAMPGAAPPAASPAGSGQGSPGYGKGKNGWAEPRNLCFAPTVSWEAPLVVFLARCAVPPWGCSRNAG